MYTGGVKVMMHNLFQKLTRILGRQDVDEDCNVDTPIGFDRA